MKTVKQIRAEIEALKRLAAAVPIPNDCTALASIAGQINVLEWVAGRK